MNLYLSCNIPVPHSAAADGGNAECAVLMDLVIISRLQTLFIPTVELWATRPSSLVCMKSDLVYYLPGIVNP